MGSTTEHISIRVPVELTEALRREARHLDRSLSWVIVNRLRGPATERSSAKEEWGKGRHGSNVISLI